MTEPFLSEEGQLDERLLLRHGDVGTVLGRIICVVTVEGQGRLFVVFVDGQPGIDEDTMIKAGMSRLGYCQTVRGTTFHSLEELAEKIEDRFFEHIQEGLYESYKSWPNPGGAAEPGGNGRAT